MKIKFESRNPVAGNAWRYNKAKKIAPKKGIGAIYNRARNKKDFSI